MSSQSPSGGRPQRRSGLWNLIKQRFGTGRDSSFQESLQNVIETHAASGGESQIADEAKLMMLNIIEFADMRVEDVMVPRADIVALEDTANIRALLETFIDANHSRVPIYKETLDDIAGFIHVKDFLRWMAQRSSQKKRTSKATTAAKPAAPGFSLTASELAQWTNQDKTRVSQCLAELSEGGLLSRTKDKEDGRRVTIKLLPKGKRLFARISPKAQELETELFSILSPAEQNALSGLMDRLQAWAFQFTKSGKPF